MPSGPTDDAGSGQEDGVEDDPQERKHQQFETIVRVLPDPVYALDENGYLTYTNRSFDRQFGYLGDRGTEGLHFSEITTDTGADTVRTLLRELITDSDDEVPRRTVSLEGLTADGRALELEGSIGLLPHSGSFDGAAGVMRDVTAEKRQEEVFEVMDRALRHNLRTVVNLIVGYADILEDEVDESNAEYLDQIQDGANWLGKLGETLRTLQSAIDQSLDTGGSVTLQGVIESAVETNREAYPEANVESHFSARGQIDAGTPLEHAIENVIENGIVHNDSDPPEVDIWVTHAPREGWIDIHIEDNGPGIPADEREIVLGEADITQLQHGSGIGLWITRWVVQVFDGKIEIEDNEPRGAVVSLRLPLADQDATPSSD